MILLVAASAAAPLVGVGTTVGFGTDVVLDVTEERDPCADWPYGDYYYYVPYSDFDCPAWWWQGQPPQLQHSVTPRAPSLDLHVGGVTIRAHLLDSFLWWHEEKEARVQWEGTMPRVWYVGGDIAIRALDEPIAGPVRGVARLLGTLHSAGFDDRGWAMLGIGARLGLEAGDRMHAGVYISPTLGFTGGPGETSEDAADVDLVATWPVQFSMWYEVGKRSESPLSPPPAPDVDPR